MTSSPGSEFKSALANEEDFPKLPDYQGSWASVLWEPMIGSGERLTAVIGVLGSDGKILVRSVLRPNVIRALYGPQAGAVLDMLQWLSDSLSAHLEREKSFNGWIPPFMGAWIQQSKTALGKDLLDIFQQAIFMTASLASLDATFDDSELERAVPGPDRWKKDIESTILQSEPALKSAFRKKIVLAKGARETIVDFVGSRIVANFGRLTPKYLSRLVKDAKSQIADLAAARDQFSIFPPEERFRLMLWKPDKAHAFDYSNRDFQSLDAAFKELEFEGDKLSLIVRSYKTSTEAAREILLHERKLA